MGKRLICRARLFLEIISEFNTLHDFLASVHSEMIFISQSFYPSFLRTIDYTFRITYTLSFVVVVVVVVSIILIRRV